MPVITIEISNDLRNTIDGFILSNCSVEHGGFVFGTPTKLVSFLPVPNVAENKSNTYKAEQNWQWYVKSFSEVIGYDVVGHIHTHPNHSIPSGQDVKSGSYWFNYVRYQILIAPNKDGRKTTWWVMDKEYEVQDLIETNENIEIASLLLAKRFGFVNLGQVLLDRTGKLVAEGSIANTLLDEDARTLYMTLYTKGVVTNKTAMNKESPISQPRTKMAFEKLKNSGLVEESYKGIKTISLFSSKLN